MMNIWRNEFCQFFCNYFHSYSPPIWHSVMLLIYVHTRYMELNEVMKLLTLCKRNTCGVVFCTT